MRVGLLKVPPLSLVLLEPGTLMSLSCTWYMNATPRGSLSLVTALATTTPLRVYISSQSLSLLPASAAALLLARTGGPPRESVGLGRASATMLWNDHGEARGR